LVYAEPSDSVIRLISYSSIAILCLMLLLIFQILWLRLSHNSRLLREKKFLELWRPLLMSEISGNAPALPPLKTRDAEFFLNLWNHLQESVKGPARKRLNGLAVQSGMAAYAHSLLLGKGLRQKLMALVTLGNLQDSTAWSDILPLTRERDRRLSLSAFSALLRINASAALSELKTQLTDRDDWPPAQLAILIQESGAMETTSMLVSYARELADSTAPGDLHRLQRLLPLIVATPSHEKLQAIRAILATATDSEVIAQCIKSLGDPEDLSKIRTYAEHPAWLVRLQVARALGRIGSTDDLPMLLKLLCDPEWSVRRRSADAIVILVRNDENRLAELLAIITDPFARDMLTMSITESRLK